MTEFWQICQWCFQLLVSWCAWFGWHWRTWWWWWQFCWQVENDRLTYFFDRTWAIRRNCWRRRTWIGRRCRIMRAKRPISVQTINCPNWSLRWITTDSPTLPCSILRRCTRRNTRRKWSNATARDCWRSWSATACWRWVRTVWQHWKMFDGVKLSR